MSDKTSTFFRAISVARILAVYACRIRGGIYHTPPDPPTASTSIGKAIFTLTHAIRHSRIACSCSTPPARAYLKLYHTHIIHQVAQARPHNNVYAIRDYYLVRAGGVGVRLRRKKQNRGAVAYAHCLYLRALSRMSNPSTCPAYAVYANRRDLTDGSRGGLHHPRSTIRQLVPRRRWSAWTSHTAVPAGTVLACVSFWQGGHQKDHKGGKSSSGAISIHSEPLSEI